MASTSWKASAFLSLLASVQAQLSPDPNHFTSPEVFPSPNATGSGGWEEAHAQAQEFLSQLTIEEKAYIATGVNGPWTGNIAPIPRLGFNGICMQDGPAGNKADFASVFPAGITTAATWDRKFFFERGAAMAKEFKGKGAHVALAPVAGPMGRMPLNGRSWEGFGPDPYLAASAFALSVEGMQSVGTQACGKHFIANEQETQRLPSTNDAGVEIRSISTNIDDRTLHELYMWPFADAVKSGMASIMCSYNRVNQTHACENSKLMNGLLKGELGYQGYVVSDWTATHSGSKAINAGSDMDQPGRMTWPEVTAYSWFGANISVSINNGSLSESRLDDMVLRIMTPYYLLGQDKDYPSIDPSVGDVNSFDPADSPEGMDYEWNMTDPRSRDVRGDHAELIHDIAAHSTVLLKNTNGTLPLKAPKNIGVFGNDASDLTTGQYNYGILRGPGYDMGTLAVGGGSGRGRFTDLVAPLEAIKQRARQDKALVQYVLSNEAATSPEQGPLGGNFGQVYPEPEVCLVFLKTWATEGYDRSSYEMDWNSTQLVSNVTSFCSNTVVVMHSTGVNTLPWADNENVTAIVAAHLPGEQTGNSLVSVLWGDVNPSGHLPYTIPYSESDYNTEILNITMDNNTDPNA